MNFNDIIEREGRPITFDEFMAATPEERRAYIIQGNAAQYGYSPEYGYAANLRNISGANGQALSPEQYQQILQSSNIDPTQAQGIGNNLGLILDNQQKALDDSSFWRQGILAGAGALGGAFLGAGALGAGTSAADAGLGLDAGSFYGSNADLDAMLAGFGADSASTGATLGGSALMPAAIPESPEALAAQGLTQTGPGQFEQLYPSSFYGGLGAGAGAAAGSGLLNGLGNASGGGTSLADLNSLLGTGKGAFDTATAVAPAIAAIAYAKNQNPFDTSRLESVYNSFNPNSLAYQYDQNTALGRDALTSSLQNRGVIGSSFGNMDLTNYNTNRDLGRQSLINQGLGQQASVANQILQAQVQDRALKNQLYGSALYSLGNIFGGKR